MTSVLYLSRTGLLEPLGQSQVFSYLRGLSKSYSIILVTCEHVDDWSDTPRVNALKDECFKLGITWLPQLFHVRSKFCELIMIMLTMKWIALRELRRNNIRLIHARSYIPAIVALFVYKLTKVPFIFDMRALWPEEMITANRLRRDSLIHKIIVQLERSCLRNARVVISLTHAGVDYLNKQYPTHFAKDRVVVIPTCADLDRFVPSSNPADRVSIGCLGSVLSGWFRLDWLRSFISVALDKHPDLIFEITTRDDPIQVRSILDPNNCFNSRLRIASSPSSSVHHVLQRQYASVMFYSGGQVSELGRSPTRMAEVLGCGLPVVANAGVGDVARVIQEFNVGVLVNSASDEDMLLAWNQLQVLLQDRGLASRCRQAAESIFSLKQGTQAYLQVYKKILESKLAQA